MFHMLCSKMHCSCDTCEQVTGMAASKYKRSLKKKLNSELAMVVSSLRKENAYLKRTLAELTHQQLQHNKLVEVIMLTLLSLIIFTIFLYQYILPIFKRCFVVSPCRDSSLLKPSGSSVPGNLGRNMRKLLHPLSSCVKKKRDQWMQ